MIKYLLNILAVFLMLSSFCFAKNDDIALQNEYGPDLTKAPFFLRFDFNNKYNKSWEESSYDERKNFLIKYQKDLITEQKQEKAKARAQAQKDRELLRQKRAEEREERNRLRQQQAEERAEQRDQQERQKAFDRAVSDEQKELDRARQQELRQQQQ